MKYPKYHPELCLGPKIERGTAETFVSSLVKAGVEFGELIKVDPLWESRLKYHPDARLVNPFRVGSL